jgi:hypothetical protein
MVTLTHARPLGRKREGPGLTALTLTSEFALYSLGGPARSAPAAGAAGPPPFSPARYSRYKYGSVTAADTFARDLVAAFGERHPGLAWAPRLLMTSSPYACVPTAATTLARRMRPALNEARARYGLSPVPLVQVDRIGSSAGDYGTLSAAARDQRMAASTLSFRRFRPDQVRDAHLLVIDDVRVTGAHQRCLMRASEELPLRSRAFLYIASFSGPADGDLDPTLEDALNHAAVTTLDDLAQIVETGDFAWNVRVCKFALSPVNRHDLLSFLGRMPGWFVRGLHRNSSQDGYAAMGLYAPSHAVVAAELARRYGEAPGAVPARRRSA